MIVAIKSSGKRNKKYNPFKVGEKMMRKGLFGLAVFNSRNGINGDKRCLMVDYRDGHKFRVSENAARAIADVEHPWVIYCIATGVERNGKARMEVGVAKVDRRLYQSEPEFLNFINNAHEALEADFKDRNKLTNVSWLAQPNGERITHEQIAAILTKYGAW